MAYAPSSRQGRTDMRRHGDVQGNGQGYLWQPTGRRPCRRRLSMSGPMRSPTCDHVTEVLRRGRHSAVKIFGHRRGLPTHAFATAVAVADATACAAASADWLPLQTLATAVAMALAVAVAASLNAAELAWATEVAVPAVMWLGGADWVGHRRDARLSAQGIPEEQAAEGGGVHVGAAHSHSPRLQRSRRRWHLTDRWAKPGPRYPGTQPAVIRRIS